MPCSHPAEVDASQRIELCVVRSVEVAQFPQHVAINTRVNAAFRLAETPHSLGSRPQTRKALGGVEVKMAPGDDRPKSEERLYVGQLIGGVRNKPFAVYQVDLTTRKDVEPASQVSCVQTDIDGRP